jgi:superfamily II DNA or RNA helicase
MSNEVVIKWLNPVFCEINKADLDKIAPCLEYPAVHYVQERFGRRRIDYQKKTYRKVPRRDAYYFFTGFLDKVSVRCRELGHEVKVVGEIFNVPSQSPNLNHITFKDGQQRMIRAACKAQRGVIQAPTGYGKTIIELGIMSCYPKENILLLCHSKDIIRQTVKQMHGVGFDSVGILQGQNRRIGRVTAATIQTFSKLDLVEQATHWDVVIIDEAHHVSAFKGQYAKVLQRLMAPIRLGFTATLPYTEEAKMTLEAMLGPKIDEITIGEGTEEGLLAVPKIKLVKSPFNQRIRSLRRYPEVYADGIVSNISRNRMILNLTKKHVDQGDSVLILVNQIEHGSRLRRLGRQEFDMHCVFIKGKNKDEDRALIKETFSEKYHLCVIATTVWKEGVDIPSLNVVINAAGGKSEIATLQAIGRGLRATEDKKEVVVIDIFDPSHPYLISHFGERVTLYMDKGWL